MGTRLYGFPYIDYVYFFSYGVVSHLHDKRFFPDLLLLTANAAQFSENILTSVY